MFNSQLAIAQGKIGSQGETYVSFQILLHIDISERVSLSKVKIGVTYIPGPLSNAKNDVIGGAEEAHAEKDLAPGRERVAPRRDAGAVRSARRENGPHRAEGD